MATDITLLKQSPGQMARHPHTGANYYEGADIIAHLSRCFGPAGWSWTTGEHGYDELADQVYVVGTLTARVVVDTLDGSERTLETSHTERGWQTANRRKSDGSFVDLGNDFKAADTDALKRAARLLGVGLDAWSKRQPAARPVVLHEPSSLSPSGRDAAEVIYRDQLQRALDLDFRASWTATDPRTFSDVQLVKYGDLLAAYIERHAVQA